MRINKKYIKKSFTIQPTVGICKNFPKHVFTNINLKNKNLKENWKILQKITKQMQCKSKIFTASLKEF